jgi:hypothetical protein
MTVLTKRLHSEPPVDERHGDFSLIDEVANSFILTDAAPAFPMLVIFGY